MISDKPLVGISPNFN